MRTVMTCALAALAWAAPAWAQGFRSSTLSGRAAVERLCEEAGIACTRAHAVEIDGRCVDPEFGRAVCVRDSDGGEYVFHREAGGRLVGKVKQEPKRRHMRDPNRTPRPRRTPQGGPH